MKIPATILSLAAMLLAGCSGGHKNDKAHNAPPSAVQKAPALVYTDTLQYIHFDGNADYWHAFFVDAKKDTIRLVTDDNNWNDKLLGKLLQVKWRNDTLTEAGDGERPYPDKRLVTYTELPGKPFAQPLTEQMAVQAVKDLELFKANADRAGVSEKPTVDKRYYQIETSTEVDDGHLSRFLTFRVYFYPKYEIKIYDLGNDKEMSLDEWHKANQ